jgi:hypothetical protein
MPMRVRTTRALVPNLLHYLSSRPDALVTRVADDVIAVSLLGSLRVDGQQRELEHRLRAWEAGGRNARAEVLPDETTA